MTAFTDRMIAAGMVPTIADEVETDLRNELAAARAARARVNAQIDVKTAELDILKADRTAQINIITAITETLGDPAP